MTRDNLAKDAMLARKAGMTYGQWKALQPVVKFERKPDERECVCEFCGKTFVKLTNQKRKYCDWTCSNNAANARLKERKENNNGQG